MRDDKANSGKASENGRQLQMARTRSTLCGMWLGLDFFNFSFTQSDQQTARYSSTLFTLINTNTQLGLLKLTWAFNTIQSGTILS